MEATIGIQNLYNLVALFLAEAMRTRRTSLARAAEISKRVVSKLASITNENQALSMLTDVEKDFEEVATLKQAIHFGYEATSLKVFEKEIKEYASKILTQNLNLSNAFLQDAALPNMTIEQLCIKYPDFCSYVYSVTEKSKLLPGLMHE